MLKKYPRSKFSRYFLGPAKIIIAFEATGCLVSYLVWHRMNTSQDFRLFMHKNCSYLLEGYYKLGESISSDNLKIRQQDIETWKAKGEI